MTGLQFAGRNATQARLPLQIRNAKEIGAKTGRAWLLIFLDMLFCSLVYRAGCADYGEWEFYHMRHAQRKTYITQGVNHKMARLFNQREYSHWLDNKIDFYERFTGYLQRDWLNLYTASQGDFVAFVKKHPVFIAKPAFGAKGLEQIDGSACGDYYALRQRLMAKDQFLVEEKILQHAALERLSPNSLAALRLITFSDGSGVHLLRCVLRMECPPGGELYAFVDECGVVQSGAIDKTGREWEQHPLTGVRLPGFRLPYFREALQMVFQASREIPQIRYVGWDAAITPNGPLLLEADPSSSAYQPKASRFPGRICGDLPTYRLYMKI